MLTQRQRSHKLETYRKQQAALAWERDDGMCQRCGAVGGPPHHAYGHAATWDETFKMHERYERADRLLTLCINCHARCHRVAPLISKQEIIAILERVLQGVT